MKFLNDLCIFQLLNFMPFLCSWRENLDQNFFPNTSSLTLLWDIWPSAELKVLLDFGVVINHLGKSGLSQTTQTTYWSNSIAFRFFQQKLHQFIYIIAEPNNVIFIFKMRKCFPLLSLPLIWRTGLASLYHRFSYPIVSKTCFQTRNFCLDIFNLWPNLVHCNSFINDATTPLEDFLYTSSLSGTNCESISRNNIICIISKISYFSNPPSYSLWFILPRISIF